MLERIGEYVAYWARTAPQREAAVDGTQRLTYAELAEAVDLLASRLAGSGLQRGDRILCRTQPSVEAWTVFLAVASIGATWVCVTSRQTEGETAHIAENSAPRLRLDLLQSPPTDGSDWLRLADLSTVAPNDSALAEQRSRVQGTDAAAIIYTSGTTGTPKGAQIPHQSLTFCGEVQASHWYPHPPRKLCDLPLNHIGGLGDVCTSTLVAGGTLILRDRFEAVGAVRAIEAERVTHLYYIPTQLLAMVESSAWADSDLSSLKWIIWGGACAPRSLLVELAATGATLATSYSLTESVGSLTYTAPTDDLETLTWSIGRVDPSYEVELFTDQGLPAAAGMAGEIRTRGRHVFSGYFGDPEKTAQTIDSDGWLHTGDLAVREENGSLRLVGRRSDMYKSGGFNVYPREVERTLEQHPAVQLAAVIGVRDERWGEVGHAYVVADESTTAEELEAFLRDRLANYKLPKRFMLERSLPMLGVGKVDRGRLKQRALSSITN